MTYNAACKSRLSLVLRCMTIWRVSKPKSLGKLFLKLGNGVAFFVAPVHERQHCGVERGLGPVKRQQGVLAETVVARKEADSVRGGL